MNLLPARLAVGYGIPAPFLGVNGTPPYTYKVLPNGAGGTIGASSGDYVAPRATGVDVVQVTDSLGAKATTQVFVGTAMELVCDILQTELELAVGRVYLWDQKIFSPTDDGLFIAVGIVMAKPFSNTSRLNGDGELVQSVNMQTTVSIDAISRSTEALRRKEEILMALAGQYSQSQQELNGFRVFPLTKQFVNLSEVDGAAIPYRFNLTVAVQYFVTKTASVPYFDTFSDVAVVTEP